MNCKKLNHQRDHLTENVPQKVLRSEECKCSYEYPNAASISLNIILVPYILITNSVGKEIPFQRKLKLLA